MYQDRGICRYQVRICLFGFIIRFNQQFGMNMRKQNSSNLLIPCPDIRFIQVGGSWHDSAYSIWCDSHYRPCDALCAGYEDCEITVDGHHNAGMCLCRLLRRIES